MLQDVEQVTGGSEVSDTAPSGECRRCHPIGRRERSNYRRVDLRPGRLQFGRRSRSQPPPMYRAEIPLILAICPALPSPPSSLVSAVLSMLEAAVTMVSVAGRSSCASLATAALRANPNASRPSRVTPRAFIVELPFTDRVVGKCGIRLSTDAEENRNQYAVLKPGYLGKSYQLASAVTRVAEKPLTCSETHCERRMSK
jgi:hypothetical protein